MGIFYCTSADRRPPRTEIPPGPLSSIQAGTGCRPAKYCSSALPFHFPVSSLTRPHQCPVQIAPCQNLSHLLHIFIDTWPENLHEFRTHSLVFVLAVSKRMNADMAYRHKPRFPSCFMAERIIAFPSASGVSSSFTCFTRIGVSTLMTASASSSASSTRSRF